MGLTAARLNSDYTQHLYSVLQQCLKVYFHHLKGIDALLAQLSQFTIVLGKILRTFHLVYLQLCSGNPPLAHLKASQSEQ
jgi:hypothetical protein